MINCNPIVVPTHVRGRMSSWEDDEQMVTIQTQNSFYFIEWIPNSLMSSICDIPLRGLNTAALFVANTTVLRDLLISANHQLTRMQVRRAFVHWYISDGLDTVEIDETRSNMTDLIWGFRVRPG
jgi:tubulin beta